MGKATKWGLLFLILLFPSLLYISLSTGKHNLFSLPYYGPYSVENGIDTVYNTLEIRESIDSRIWDDLDTCNFVIAFIDPSNRELNSRIGTQLSALAEKLNPMQDFRILVLSNDNIKEESQITEAFKSSSNKWQLINLGDQLETFVQSYFAWDKENLSTYRRMYLIDKQSFVRGVYKGDEYAKVKDLSDDIKALKADELTPKKRKK